MGIIDNGNKGFSRAMKSQGLIDQMAFAFTVTAVIVDLEGFAENPQRIVIRVKRPVDQRGDHAFLVVTGEGPLDEAFAGSRISENQTKTALPGMDQEHLEDTSLLIEKAGRVLIEGEFLKAEV